MILKAPSLPAWVVREAPWQPQRNQTWESLTTLANGYLGVRGFPEEPFDAGPTLPGIYVAGVFDPGADGVPELVNVSNFLAVEIVLDGSPVRLAPERVSQYARTLDLKRGILRRSCVYREDGRATRLEFERFASMVHRHVAAQALSVTPLDWRGDVVVCAWLDANVRNREAPHLRVVHAERMGRDRLLLVTQTLASRTRIGHACRCTAWVRESEPPGAREVAEPSRIGLEYRCRLETGQQAVFDRVTATYTSRDPDTITVERSCLDEIRNTLRSSYGARRREHVRHWERRWARADITIDGPEADQLALRFASFHLLQSCPLRDESVSIAAKGLSGEGYRGHVFWDTEIFMLPFFTWNAPARARRLLRYRVRGLDGARRKATAAGCRGAMFPWESADTGDEVCPLFVTVPGTGERVEVRTGQFEQHITADVVYAAWRYVQTTGDTLFREHQLLPMLVETARFWESRIESAADGSCALRRVIGPDEYHELVDNNAFTNYVAAWCLRLAAEEVRRTRKTHRHSYLLRSLGVGPAEPLRWQALADRLPVPADAAGVLEQHAGFFQLPRGNPAELGVRGPVTPEHVRLEMVQQTQVLKQADVLMLLTLFPEAFTPEMKARNWDYYEPRTAHDSSLSPSVHSILASDIGLNDKAYDYFRRSALLDLDDLMGNTADGLHCAALGGTWQAVIRGFLGLRLGQERPIPVSRLPANWRRVRTHVRCRRRWYAIEVTQSEATARIVPSPRARAERVESAEPAALSGG